MNSLSMLSVVIPFYNEEANVVRVVHGIESSFLNHDLKDYEIIAVDNGSWDKTGQILLQLHQANHKVKIVHVPVNKGMGYGIQTGLKQASGNYLCIQCGDGQTEPDEIVRIFEKIKKENLDICKVNRTIRGDGIIRKFISKVFNTLSNLMFQTRTRDVNGLPKIMTKKVYETLSLESKGWFLDAEIMIKAVRNNMSIGEVETRFYKREGGSSNVNWKTIMEFIWKMIDVKIRGFESDRTHSSIA